MLEHILKCFVTNRPTFIDVSPIRNLFTQYEPYWPHLLSHMKENWWKKSSPFLESAAVHSFVHSSKRGTNYRSEGQTTSSLVCILFADQSFCRKTKKVFVVLRAKIICIYVKNLYDQLPIIPHIFEAMYALNNRIFLPFLLPKDGYYKMQYI